MASAPQLLAKIGQYYYLEQLTMAEIGQRLGFSRHKVGRLIKEAVDSGIVKIEIESPFAKGVRLEQELEAATNLTTCIVVDVDGQGDQAAIKELVCTAGAEFVAERIKSGDVIGIGWGSTTHQLVEKFSAKESMDVTVVQVTGGNKHLATHFDCQDVTRRFAEKLNVAPVLLHAPAIVDSPEARDVICKQETIASTFAYFDKLDVTIVGIGSLVPSRASMLLNSGYISETEIQALVDAGAVGDVFSYFIDSSGGVVESSLFNRVIAIGTEQLRKVKTSIGVATGAEKAKAVRAAILGGFITTLVIDSVLARALLDEIERSD